MGWIYLVESEECLWPLKNGCDQSPIVKSIPIANVFFYHGWLKEDCIKRQYLKMYMNLQNYNLREIYTSYMEDSPVKISLLQDLEKAWQESEALYVMKSLGSLMKYDPTSFSWKMSQLLPQKEALKWSHKLPKWGMIVDGLLSQLLPWAQYIKGNAGFCLPTPKASDSKRNDSPCERKRDSPDLTSKLNLIHKTKGKKVHPHFIEWVMMFPLGWTELEPLETQSCPPKLEKLFASCRALHKNK